MLNVTPAIMLNVRTFAWAKEKKIWIKFPFKGLIIVKSKVVHVLSASDKFKMTFLDKDNLVFFLMINHYIWLMSHPLKVKSY